MSVAIIARGEACIQTNAELARGCCELARHKLRLGGRFLQPELGRAQSGSDIATRLCHEDRENWFPHCLLSESACS